MDLNYTPEENTFREAVRAFLRDKLPKELSEKVRTGVRLNKQDYVIWHSVLNKQGWLATNWPVEFGGTGWTSIQRHIFEEEMAMANGPRVVPFGLSMLAPVLLHFGSKAQQDYYLPRILDGTDWWCQGYSEPDAGSDLASLKTRAVRDGDEYVVNGQKTWTTLGQYADWIFCLVRTDPEAKAQRGISFLLIDMKTPGITVRPIKLMDGSVEVNEIFFDDVRVPAANLVGEENKGWDYAKFLLTHERTNIAGVGFSTKELSNLKAIARTEQSGGRPLIENPLFAANLATIEIDLMATATTNLRVIAQSAAGEAPGAESSMLKIKGTVIRQAINDLTRRALGPYALPHIEAALEDDFEGERVGPPYAAPVSPLYFNNRKLSIFGGSNEIQRSIICKAILGL